MPIPIAQDTARAPSSDTPTFGNVDIFETSPLTRAMPTMGGNPNKFVKSTDPQTGVSSFTLPSSTFPYVISSTMAIV